MPPRPALSKPLVSTGGNLGLDCAVLDALADPSKCDDRLARRLARALNISEPLTTSKPVTGAKGKQKSVSLVNDTGDRRILAMRAANAASQSLGKVVKSGWKALDTTKVTVFSTESVSSMVLSFRTSIAFLREVGQASVETERVASSFVGKLVAVQAYESALEILVEIRANIIRNYSCMPRAPAPGKAVARSTSKPLFAKYMHLVQYPHPAPQDPVLLALIGTNLCHALAAVTAVVSPSCTDNSTLEKFIALMEGVDGPLFWHSVLPTEHADTLLARIHRSLVTTFSYSNTPSSLLLRFRALSLRCLLCRISLDPDLFWAQATEYIASHGKNVAKSEDALNAVHDVVGFFDSIVALAKGRRDADSFLSGAGFLKFCEIALIFAKRGHSTSLSNITRFIHASCSVESAPGLPEREVSDVKLRAILSQGVAMVERYGDTSEESDIIDSILQCSEALSKFNKSFTLDFRSQAIRPMEKLRRICSKVLESPTAGKVLRNSIKSLLILMVEIMESCAESQQTNPAPNGEDDFTAQIVDVLCSLAKVELSPANADTHAASYNFLRRGIIFIDSRKADISTNKEDGNLPFSLARVMRVLAGAFWNSAVVLYQDGRYSTAIRFLVQACEITTNTCHLVESVGLNDSDESKNESWKVLRSHLPTRWELLGDCYFRIGERKLAYGAFLDALKSHSFHYLCHSTNSSTPSQLSSDIACRRIASLVERITYIAVFDLLMQGDASLRQILCSMGVDREVVGVILEWQAASLMGSSWKLDAQTALHRILRDSSEIYDPDFPMRRSRVLLQQLDLAYRMDDSSIPVDEIAADIQNLLSQDPSKDAGFVGTQAQYSATMHIWMVFHTHRSSQDRSLSSSIIFYHATQASKILSSMLPPVQAPVRVKSPKPSSKSVAKKPAKSAVRIPPRTGAKIVDAIPVTPKSRKTVMRTPPNPRTSGASAHKSSPIKVVKFSMDNHLVTSIQMVAQLLGLLGRPILKIQFLNILQRMAEQRAGPSADDFVRASVDAANVYARLGKSRRAMAIYAHALAAVSCTTTATVSDEVRVLLLLHYAASHALNGDAKMGSRLYQQARDLSEGIESRQDISTMAKIRTRVLTLERSALASNVFAAIQISQGDSQAAFSTLRKSLRLWNRAFDALSRLHPSPAPAPSNPFDMTSLEDALPQAPGPQVESTQSKKYHPQSTVMSDLQWRIAEGLLQTLFGLGQAYFIQGTVRAAEFFVEQARDLAQGLNSPALLSRALAKKGELQLRQGKLEDAADALFQASNLSQDIRGIDAADVNRLRAHHSQLTDNHEEAKALYLEIVDMLSDLERTLSSVENSAPCPTISTLPQSPGKSRDTDVLVPGFLATVLRQQIWLRRDEPQTEKTALLSQISSLPPSKETKAEELAILARLSLHEAHMQFHADLFLSSLTESTIALPMGAPSHDTKLSSSAGQMVEKLSTAEKMFWASLDLASNCGQVSDIREAIMSLVLIQFFQSSLGKSWATGSRVIARLLDTSAAITLRREFVDEINHKFPEVGVDDLIWPTVDGGSHTIPSTPSFTRAVESRESPTINLEAYWLAVRDKCHCSYYFDNQSVCEPEVDLLPPQWTVVSISITDDKTTMFFSRQRRNKEPLIFCVPLERHGRKEEDKANQFTFLDAIERLRAILRESDASAEEAKDVPSQDRKAKAAWWAKRAALDKRMRELLENIEFCWLGAFKTILSEPFEMLPDILNNFRVRLENVFKRNLASDKKRMSHVKLDDALMECFASLSPRCSDEELEDLAYFVLDLYQFHGVHIVLSEVDMEQLIVELRTELEEHVSKTKDRMVPMKDSHLFLVLDKNVQGIPWESIPILRGRSVSRVPSLSFLVDRIELAKLQRESVGASFSTLDRAVVNPKQTYYILNPSGDLTKSQARFGSWVKEMEHVGWKGVVGRIPSEQDLLNALSKMDLVIYFGHGGAEQYVRSSKIRGLQRCAATMLWGCSSGLMREMGDFDRIGTPYNYMLAGCPTLVACLWDVTDNELDKISRSVFDKLGLDPEHTQAWCLETMDEATTSVVTAVGQSRDACKLKYLTGAAPVVYGIPFYL